MPLQIQDCGFKKELQCDYRKLLGKGSYGNVFKCIHKNSRTGEIEKYVVKHSSEGGIDKELEFADNIEKGCALNSNMILYTRYIIPIYRTNKRNTVALQYAQVLDKYKTDPHLHSKMNLEGIFKMTNELHEAVTHIHDKLGIIHNDIKPDNIGMLNGQIKLLDLGLTKKVTDPLDLRSGTIGYNPPNKNYSSKIVVDMWAVGCTMFEIISRSYRSLFWADSLEELEIAEFAAAVIMEDLVDLSGNAIVKYLLGYSSGLELEEFEQTSLMGFHSSLVRDQLEKLRRNYSANLKAFPTKNPSLRTEITQKITQKIMQCFEYSLSFQGGGGMQRSFLKIPVKFK